MKRHPTLRTMAIVRAGEGWRLIPDGPRAVVFASKADALLEAARLVTLAGDHGLRTTLLVQEAFGELRPIALGSLPAAPRPSAATFAGRDAPAPAPTRNPRSTTEEDAYGPPR